MKFEERVYQFINNLSPYKTRSRSCTKEYLNYQQEKAILLKKIMPGLEYKNKSILEVGCGEGGLSTYFAASKAKQVIGIDVCEKKLKFAKKLKKEKKLKNCKFEMCDAKQLPFKNNEFDLVVSYDSMEHFDDPYKILKEMKRVLKPEGDIIAWFTNWDSHNAHHSPTKIPWAHLIFSEKIIMKHRSKFIGNNKKRYKDIILNKINYQRFEKITNKLGFDIKERFLLPTGVKLPFLFRLLKDYISYFPFIRKYFVSTVFIRLNK